MIIGRLQPFEVNIHCASQAFLRMAGGVDL